MLCRFGLFSSNTFLLATTASNSSFYSNKPESKSYAQSETSTAPGVNSPFSYKPQSYYNASNPYKPIEETIRDEHSTKVPPAFQTVQQKRADVKAVLSGQKKEVVTNENGIPLASTVICVSPEFKLLFIKRSKQMKFMPNLYAFPGGRVDPMDLELAMKDKTVTRAMNKKPGLGRLKERIAALRELNEELSVSVEDCAGIHLASDPAKKNMNDFSCISQMVPFQRWITPPQETRRFDTYFFFLPVQKDVATKVPLIMNEGEIADARWLTPKEAFELHHKPDSGFRLPPPTQVIVHILRQNYKDPAHMLTHYNQMFAPNLGRNPLGIEPKVSICPRSGDFLMGLTERDTAEEFLVDDKKGAGRKRVLIGDFGYEIPPGFMKSSGPVPKNPNPKMYVVV